MLPKSSEDSIQSSIESDIPELYSSETEDALLGAILLNPEIYSIVSAKITEVDFSSARNRWIWHAMTVLAGSGRNIDVVSVAEILKRNKQLNDVGGAAYLAGLIEAVPSSYHADVYAQIVRDYALRRAALKTLSEAAKNIITLNKPVLETITVTQSALDDLPIQAVDGCELHDQVSELFDVVEARIKNPCDVWGVPTGFSELDHITGGWQNGESTIVYGVPGMGKSTLALQTLAHAAENNHYSHFYSLEMPARQQLRRLISVMTAIRTRQMHTGRISPEEWKLFCESSIAVEAMPFRIIDRPWLTTAEIRADIIAQRKKRPVEFAVIDYLALLGDMKGRPVYEREAAISTNIKCLARELNIPVLTIHRTNKEGLRTKNPTMADGAGPAATSFDADNIIWLGPHLPEEGEAENKDFVTLSLLKMRDAEHRGYLHLRRVPGKPCFAEIAREIAPNGWLGRKDLT